MPVVRAKTMHLFSHQGLTDAQVANGQTNLEELQARRTVLTSYPRRVVLEMTNACNIDCIMCGRDQAEFKQTFLDLSTLARLGETWHHSEEATLCGWGEPTLYPKFGQLLAYLDDYPIKKYLVTNGTLLDKWIPELFKRQVAIVTISLDGASPEVNDRIRRRAEFNQIVANLKVLMETRRQQGGTSPYVNLVITLMRSNLTELPRLVMLAKELGMEEVKAIYLSAFSQHLVEETLWGQEQRVAEVFAETTELAERLGILLKLPYIQGEDVAGALSHKPCFVAWRDFFLGSDGYVRPCQSTAMKLFHVSRYGSFMEMWNADEFQSFRRRVNDEATMPDECRRCYHAAHANWNKKESFIQLDVPFAPVWERTEHRRTGSP
ncbi:MAG: radical SAM protein [Magnetococcus sp. DMHC-8]